MLVFEDLLRHREKIAVVGLGYVGLPLAVHLSRHFSVVGYDLKAGRIAQLNAGVDSTREVSADDLKKASIQFTDNPEILGSCRLIIVAVPTPIDAYRIPDLGPLTSASATVGKYLSRGSCVVFESTVYPGATEEVCQPVLERESGLRCGVDFSLGYSPERINPGDRVHTVDNIVKIISASDEHTCQLLADTYGRIVTAGVHRASSIRVAEAAKVIENTQRDLNIALMNELAMIFDIMGIDTQEVLEAAGTKWNFMPFKPGLVGGHCIGVDPYYLTFKAEAIGYHPEMILAGRRINDRMGKYVAERTVKLLISAGKKVGSARVALLGLTFKEDVPDLRNTKVVDIAHELRDYGVEVVACDPLADAGEARDYYGIELVPPDQVSGMDAVILAVMHAEFRQMGLKRIARMGNHRPPLIIDVKSAFDRKEAESLNLTYWRL